MAFALFEDRGTPLAQQHFTWRELAGKPISKLDDVNARRAVPRVP